MLSSISRKKGGQAWRKTRRQTRRQTRNARQEWMLASGSLVLLRLKLLTDLCHQSSWLGIQVHICAALISYTVRRKCYVTPLPWANCQGVRSQNWMRGWSSLRGDAGLSRVLLTEAWHPTVNGWNAIPLSFCGVTQGQAWPVAGTTPHRAITPNHS